MVVVAALIVRDRKILACQRSRSGPFPGKWEFPGGKVRQGEKTNDALVRELSEELGVEAQVGREVSRTRHHYAEMKEEVEVIFFEVAIASQALQNRVFEKIEWVRLADLPRMDFLEADRHLVQELARGGIGL